MVDGTLPDGTFLCDTRANATTMHLGRHYFDKKVTVFAYLLGGGVAFLETPSSPASLFSSDAESQSNATQIDSEEEVVGSKVNLHLAFSPNLTLTFLFLLLFLPLFYNPSCDRRRGMQRHVWKHPSWSPNPNTMNPTTNCSDSLAE